MNTPDSTDDITEPEDQYYIEEVQPESAEGWTTRYDEAVDEGLPYSPPTDPPVIASSDQGAEVATGFGESPEDEPYRDSAPAGDARIQAEVRRVLREDSATSKLPLTVRVEDGTVFLHGFVSDVDDIDMAESVASRVPGVEAVEDRTVVDPDRVEHAALDFNQSEESG